MHTGMTGNCSHAIGVLRICFPYRFVAQDLVALQRQAGLGRLEKQMILAYCFTLNGTWTGWSVRFAECTYLD